MTAEFLSDALSCIDDDIIEETDALRHNNKNYKSIWIKILSAAACLCIALLAVISSVAQFELPSRGGDINNTEAEEYKYGGVYGYAAGVMNSVEEVTYLEVTEWKKNCFYALVLEGENDTFSNGTRVKVKFDKNIYVGLNSNQESGELYYEQRRPTQEDFPVGSKLYVVFNKSRNSFFNSKADKVITALSIKTVKSSAPLRGSGSMMTYYYVEITEWGKKEFNGIIKGSKYGTGELPFGKEVKVRFDGDILVKKEGEKGSCYIPDEDDFPVGSRVEVLVNDNYAPKFLGESEIWIYSIGNPTSDQTAIVKITQWNENGFAGTLCGENGNLGLYYEPITAVVEFTGDTRTEEVNDRGTTTLITLAPTEEDFPVGTVVEVSYEESRMSKPNETEYFAERVWLFE